MADLIDLIKPGNVVFIASGNKREALETIVRALADQADPAKYDKYLEAVYDRENILSTGLGGGFALPHGKVPGEPQFRLGIGISSDGVMDYGSIDDQPVHLIACIIGPADRQNEYLRLLAGVTRFLKENREELLVCGNPEGVCRLVEERCS